MNSKHSESDVGDEAIGTPYYKVNHREWPKWIDTWIYNGMDKCSSCKLKYHFLPAQPYFEKKDLNLGSFDGKGIWYSNWPDVLDAFMTIDTLTTMLYASRHLRPESILNQRANSSWQQGMFDDLSLPAGSRSVSVRSSAELKAVISEAGVVSVDLRYSPSPEDFRLVRDNPHVSCLDVTTFGESRINWDGLGELASLQVLRLCGRRVDDSACSAICRLRPCHLGFVNTRVSDIGLCELESIASIKRFECSSSKIGDDGLWAICSSNKLRSLDVTRTKIRLSKGFDWNSALDALIHLDVSHTRVGSDSGLQLPDCQSLGVILCNCNPSMGNFLEGIDSLNRLFLLGVRNSDVSLDMLNRIHRRQTQCEITFDRSDSQLVRAMRT